MRSALIAAIMLVGFAQSASAEPRAACRLLTDQELTERGRTDDSVALMRSWQNSAFRKSRLECKICPSVAGRQALMCYFVETPQRRRKKP